MIKGTKREKRKYGRAQYLKHRAKRLSNSRAYNVKKKFGLSMEEVEAIKQQQNGVCAVCHQAETVMQKDTLRQLAIDHNHDTGQIRGLLCHMCNVAVGYLHDDPLRARALADYLERTSTIDACGDF